MHDESAVNLPVPVIRPRRLRRSEAIRRMVRETHLSVDNLIYPIFITHQQGAREEVASMPGVFRFGIDRGVEEVVRARDLGIPAVMLFGIPARKDAAGSDALSDDGVVQRAVRAIKQAVPDMVLITDVCFCEYTAHGHCGVLDGRDVDNDATLVNLAIQAVTHARAGADVVAPSAMMDGMVGAIRSALDSEGYEQVAILSYAVKYASAYYGPFRDAAESAPAFGDRRGYQMDPANGREALREVELDLSEGADLVMVKPALAYLDIVRDVRQHVTCPVAAYNVSGEYSMVKAAAANGWIDERRIVLETLTGIKRAGADVILTYHACDAARWLREG